MNKLLCLSLSGLCCIAINATGAAATLNFLATTQFKVGQSVPTLTIAQGVYNTSQSFYLNNLTVTPTIQPLGFAFALTFDQTPTTLNVLNLQFGNPATNGCVINNINVNGRTQINLTVKFNDAHALICSAS